MGPRPSFSPPRGLNEVNTRAVEPLTYLKGMKRFSWSPDGDAIAIARHDTNVEVWRIRADTAKLLTGHSELVSSVCWHRNSRMLASGSDDRTVRVWQLDGPEDSTKTLNGHTNYVTSVAWSWKEELVSGSDDGTVRRWDWRATLSSETLITHSDHVLDVSWSPDGEILASASWDQRIGLWEAGKGVRKIGGHNAAIYCVRWCPVRPGRLFASGDQDGFVHLWEASGRQMNRFRAHDDAVLSVSFSPDGKYLASRDRDKAKIWRIFDATAVPQEMASLVCRGTQPYASVAFDPVSDPHRLAATIGWSDEQIVVLEADYRSMINRRVFIVHGRDDEAVQAVKAALFENGLEPVSLREQPDRALSFVMDKFELYSDVAFVIVLLTPDDIGGLAGGESVTAHRARQNVILELGYFIGRLGYDRVCLLKKGDLEFPSDIAGVLYIDMDRNGIWRSTLRERLQVSRLASSAQA